MKYIHRHPQVIAYLVLVVMNCFGWYLLQENANADRERAYEGAVALCQQSFDLRMSVIVFIEGQSAPLLVPQNASPEAQEVINKQNERRATLRDEAKRSFKAPECLSNLGLRADPSGRLQPI